MRLTLPFTKISRIVGHRVQAPDSVSNREHQSTSEVPSTTNASSTMPLGKDDSGATAGVKFVTSTVGNTVGGLTRTVGNVVGAAGRGLGDTVTAVTGNTGKPVGNALGSGATGIENGTNSVATGIEDAGRGKKDYLG